MIEPQQPRFVAANQGLDLISEKPDPIVLKRRVSN